MITHCVEQFSQFQCDLTFYAGNSVSQYADTQCMNFNTLNFCVIFGRAEFFLRAFCVGDRFVVPITLSECLFPYNQWLKVIENSLEKQQTLYFCSSRRCKWIVHYFRFFYFFFFWSWKSIFDLFLVQYSYWWLGPIEIDFCPYTTIYLNYGSCSIPCRTKNIRIEIDCNLNETFE